MKPDKIIAFLDALGVDNATKHKRTGWVVSRCPLGPWEHQDGVSGAEVFGVKVEQGDPQCYCFACNYGGTVGELFHHVRGLNKVAPVKIAFDFKTANALVEEAEETEEFDFDIPGIEEVLAAKKNALHEFPAWWLETFPTVQGAPMAEKYLAARAVSPVMAKLLDLRWDPMQKRICFPVRDFAGKLRGLHGRAVEAKTDPRYRMYTQAGRNNPVIWLGESWVDLEKPIVVVEGPFDLTSVRRVYSNVVSPLFANPSIAKLNRMSDALEWLTFFDRGAGGDSGREKVEAALSKDHLINHLSPPKDFKDPGEMGVADLVNCLSEHMQLTAICA